ncbi:MAG: hypothetical protein ACOY71_05155 [Gemmatimonadota bacterium]
MRMRSFSGAVVALLAVVLLLAGCADPKLKKLSAGITQDSTFKILGQGPTVYPDSIRVRHGYVNEGYFTDGQLIQVYFYGRKPLAGPDSVVRKGITPVVFVMDTLRGWGWDYWDSVAAAHRIKVPPKD